MQWGRERGQQKDKMRHINEKEAVWGCRKECSPEDKCNVVCDCEGCSD